MSFYFAIFRMSNWLLRWLERLPQFQHYGRHEDSRGLSLPACLLKKVFHRVFPHFLLDIPVSYANCKVILETVGDVMPGWVPGVTWNMYSWTKSIELVLFSKGKALWATQGLLNIVTAWRQYQLLRWITPFYILFHWQSKSHNGSFQMISEFHF